MGHRAFGMLRGHIRMTGFPVLDLGIHPEIPEADWRLTLDGLVEKPVTLDWKAFNALPQVEDVSDFHCVTTWSRFDNDWAGVPFVDLQALARPLPEAQHVIFHSYGGYTTNVPLAELQDRENMLVHTHNGQPLTAEHGGPLRGLVPQLYFWKSAKWVRGIEFVAVDRPGFWEVYGYHMHGDSWTEERFG